MIKYFVLVAFIACWLVGCRGENTIPLPTAVPISTDLGEAVASQPGPIWVLISGVDEHGLIVEHQVTLLAEPDLEADPGPEVHTGIAATVHEIRQTGPQNLRRFFRVETVNGEVGWISDYYIRRTAYLFNEQGTTVTLHAAPDGGEVAEVGNVTPVVVRQPAINDDWWIVQTVADGIVGWVDATYVKESPEPEFLLNEQHDHPSNGS